MSDILQQDLPPGSPAYAAGPLANLPPSPPVPTAAGLRASGQPDIASYINSATPIPAAPIAADSFAGRAQTLLTRATSGLQDLFGGTPTVATATPVAGSTAALQPGRTASLESGLNDLERRSTGVRPAPVVVTAAPIVPRATPIRPFADQLIAREGR